jgi:hypothetical protein
VTINAEDFLNDDDSALGRPRWIDAIGTEFVPSLAVNLMCVPMDGLLLVLRKIQPECNLSAYFNFSALKFSVLN